MTKRRQEMKTDTDWSSWFAEYRYIGRVTTEPISILSNPVECHHLVKQTGIPWCLAVPTETEETERPNPVANREDDHLPEWCQYLAIVDRQRRRTAVEATPVDPHHDRQSATRRARRSRAALCSIGPSTFTTWCRSPGCSGRSLVRLAGRDRRSGRHG